MLAGGLLLDGESPLDIMVENMLFWHRQVDRLQEQLEEKLVDLEDPDDKKAAMQLLRQLLVCRENSQKCAVDAAPYCHPKYHSVQFQKQAEELTGIEIPSNQIEASTAYARLISS